MVLEECCNCGVPFALSRYLKAERLNDHRNFYCPNGHPQHYTGKTDAEREREARERAERMLASREEDLRIERISHAATKGQLTKTRKRVANGVCPCCHRTFQQLARHMKAKHPEHVAESG